MTMQATGVPKFPTSPERYMFAEGGRVKVGGDKVSDDSYQYRLATVNAGNGDKKVMVKIVDLEKSDDDGMLDVVQKEVGTCLAPRPINHRQISHVTRLLHHPRLISQKMGCTDLD